MTPISTLPGYLRFAWMFWMQPVSLHRLLKEAGIEDPDASGRSLWQSAGFNCRTRREYLKLRAAVPIVTTPIVASVLVMVAGLLSPDVSWRYIMLIIAISVVGGIVTSLIDVLALAVAFSLAMAVLGAAILGIPLVDLGELSSGTDLVALGVVMGLSIGGAYSVEEGVSKGMPLRTGLAGWLAFSAGGIIGAGLGVVLGVQSEVIGGVEGGVVCGVSALGTSLVTIYRFPLWPVEAILQAALFIADSKKRAPSLSCSPVLWHELSYIPLPFLGRHIENTAARDSALVQQTLQACTIAPGQREIGRRSLFRLQGRELEAIATERRFRTFTDEDTEWLPPEEGADPVVHQFRQVARFVLAADGSSFAHHRQEHLRNAARTLEGLERHLLGREAHETTAYRDALPAWRRALSERQVRAEAEAADLLPIPYRAGEPLDPERGREVFRGRESSIREIEEHLALAADARSVVLLGPRRTGKSSLLKMLPAMLPDAVCVFFDLQGHPVETPGGLFQALEEATRTQARRTRGLDLPKRPDGAPFEAAAAWIEELENRLGDRRLLFCFDEFETLERAFGGSRDDRLRLLGLFRSTIQHRRRVRLLVAGEAPFDELDPMWDSHFVSVRVVRLGHLGPEVAVDLVRRPIPSFPSEAIPEAVARRLVGRTGAQPFLVQLYAQLLVSRLNAARRWEAASEDLEAVEDEALDQVGPYFRDLWNRAPEEAQAALAELAYERHPGEIARPARQWLERRCLLDDRGRLTIPVFGRFLTEEIL